MLWTDDALAQRMREGWGGGLADGTPCGGGSTRKSAQSIAERLPALVDKYDVHTVCDAGAGDRHWVDGVKWELHYRAFDLVVRRPDVEQWDISARRLPMCDLILCRHVLIHFEPERVMRTIALFLESAKYLLASQYDDAPQFDASQQYNPTDLRPLLGDPIERLPDTGSDLALWML